VCPLAGSSSNLALVLGPVRIGKQCPADGEHFLIKHFIDLGDSPQVHGRVTEYCCNLTQRCCIARVPVAAWWDHGMHYSYRVAV